ncbi:MAG TPA: 5-carboxymethyl-2-hydroxymuconate Delta-isomerase [Noviherbaspirillum sp.]|uniref:5-carboxymethyl-2-hydroxymuconate Delta-isomerase n=1 Tax=Noviherbaspirillum sp. TaxID=1926288 RepID=UPI002D524C69|nr:5-carboxymethyl-2-hydroxymuconate Delta-isomerase [Noviherbaspirillum sp.]HYD94473.1 5-carboxymethyl-2-hydroxymuconate Delta-isomerase [Noviherbaspirillum sp.]
MPHLTLEYTGNLAGLDVRKCLLELNRVLVSTNQFDEIDIKSRALKFDDHAVGVHPERRAFLHAKLSLLSGRSTEVKREISAALLESLRQLCVAQDQIHVQLCVEILEIERESYAKAACSPNPSMHNTEQAGK